MTEDDIGDISPAEMEKASSYKGELNYELLMSKQCNRIAIYREVNMKQFAGAIDTLSLMLMKELRQQVDKKRKDLGLIEGCYDGMTAERIVLYDKLWTFINELLEDNDLIFKKSSFERGKIRR